MPYTYYTRNAGNAATTTVAGPQVVARREAGEDVSTNPWVGPSRFRYTHASASVGVGEPLPIGSVLQEQKLAD